MSAAETLRLYLQLSLISWITSKVHFKKADVNSGQSGEDFSKKYIIKKKKLTLLFTGIISQVPKCTHIALHTLTVIAVKSRHEYTEILIMKIKTTQAIW